MSREIKGYTLQKKLGSGGMGEVWLANKDGLDIPVAIKFLHTGLLEKDHKEQYIQRFIREAKIAAAIEHNNIVKVYEASMEEGNYYIVMEYVDGCNLYDFLKGNQGKLSESETLDMAIALAEALDKAYQQKIIHRDIKPENILISKGGTVKLADLGLAKFTDSNESMTLTGCMVGTPAYISPEQAYGSDQVDHRSDIYALGATMYHIVTGSMPFSGDSPLSVMMQHVQAPLEHPKVKFPHLKDNFCSIICKMMEKSPDNRYKDYSSLLEDLYKVRDFNSPVNELNASITFSSLIDTQTVPAITKRKAPVYILVTALIACLVILLLPKKDKEVVDKNLTDSTPTAKSTIPPQVDLPQKPSLTDDKNKSADKAETSLTKFYGIWHCKYPNSFHYTFKVDQSGIHLIAAERKSFKTAFKKKVKLRYIIENKTLKIECFSATGGRVPFPKQFRTVNLENNIAGANYREDGTSKRMPLEITP